MGGSVPGGEQGGGRFLVMRDLQQDPGVAGHLFLETNC
jgi:hypothetical protein